jgi:hypothetical protein
VLACFSVVETVGTLRFGLASSERAGDRRQARHGTFVGRKKMRCLDPKGSRRSSRAPAHGELDGGRHLASTILTGGAGLDRCEDAEEDPSFEGHVAMTEVSGRAAQGRAISQKEIERPRAWAPPARRSENDFALERGETFMDRWLRLRAAGLGDEVWDRRHARGARGSVETLQKLVYVACAMTRLVRARATPQADSSAGMRDVGRVEGVRVDPLSMTVSRGSLTIGSRLSRTGERGARPDRSLREQSQDVRGTPYGAHAEQMPRA